jgi:hypothetical protein
MTAWSPQDIETLKELAGSGASRARISVRLKRTLAAVKAMAAQLGIEIKSEKDVRKNNGLSPQWAKNREAT